MIGVVAVGRRGWGGRAGDCVVRPLQPMCCVVSVQHPHVVLHAQTTALGVMLVAPRSRRSRRAANALCVYYMCGLCMSACACVRGGMRAWGRAAAVADRCKQQPHQGPYVPITLPTVGSATINFMIGIAHAAIMSVATVGRRGPALAYFLQPLHHREHVSPPPSPPALCGVACVGQSLHCNWHRAANCTIHC